MHLNSDQQKAVTYGGNKHLILVAGAGSGKTHVLKERTIYLVETGVAPKNIVVLSFTRKSSVEIKGRISEALGDRAKPIFCGTFHRFCLDIMIGSPSIFGPRKNIIDMDDQERLMSIARAKFVQEVENTSFPNPKDLVGRLSYIRNTGKGTVNYLKQYHNIDTDEAHKYIEIFKHFTILKREHNYIDFDDILSRFGQGLSNKKFLDFMARRFRHILVDEFQDTNHLQWKIISKLIRATNPPLLYCVGDAAQCHPMGTKVSIGNGQSVNIEEIVPGDRVVTYSVPNSSFEGVTEKNKVVEETSKHLYSGRIITVYAGGESTRCTPDHKWLTALPSDFGFCPMIIKAGSLQAQRMAVKVFDTNTGADKGWHEITKIEETVTNEYVYGLKVESTDDYRLYVADNLVVHNSIFGFRGSDYRNILEFSRNVPESESIGLNTNYRSYQEILNISNWVLGQSPIDYDKRLTASRGSSNKLPRLCVFENERHEALWVANDIQRRTKSGESSTYSDFLVLARTGFGIKAFEHVMINYKMPYTIIGGSSVLDAAHTKDVLSMGRAALSNADMIGWARFLCLWPRLGNIGAHKIGAKIHKCTNTDQVLKILVDAGRKDIANAVSQARKSVSPVEILSTCIRVLSPVLKVKFGQSWHTRSKDFDFLVNMARHYDSLSKFIEVYTLEPAPKKGDETEDKVLLMTVHSAKGSQRPICYVSKVQPGYFPHSRSLDNDSIEEERRLLYVALTRPQDELILTKTVDRLAKGPDFLHNVPKKLLESLSFVRGISKHAVNSKHSNHHSYNR